MTLFILSFVAGLLTVLAPCILPLLPVIVGGSLDGSGGKNMRRAFTVAFSLGASVILFTFLLKVSTLFITVPESTWSYISGGILIAFGLVSLFPSLWEKVSFAATLNQKSNVLLGAGYKQQSFWGDVLIGAALGPVFSTCSPTYFVVLATVLPVNPVLGFTYILAYTAGLCIALLLVAFVGQRIMARLNIAADPHGWFKRGLGVIFLLVGLAVITGGDKVFERKILESGVFDVTTIEQKLLQYNVSMTPTSTTTPMPTVGEMLTLADKAKRYHFSPEITKPDGFINTGGQPISIAGYRGKKVVLIDFWTYSCINCQRTLPYVTGWYEKYKDQGLVVIGVHTPEFAFEHVQSNVEAATKRFGINYPVVLDNDYGTWNAFGNQFWPRKYLIDIDGYIVYDHAGEGAYAETEARIQELLKERAERLGTGEQVTEGVTAPTNVVRPGEVRTPEIYIGSERNASYLGNGQVGREGKQSFAFPAQFVPDTVYLSGTWNVFGEYAESVASNARIHLDYGASHVYMVLSASSPVRVKVTLDGKPLGGRAGADITVENGESYLNVSEERLYELVRDPDGYGEHTIEVIPQGPGLQAFTFTFG